MPAPSERRRQQLGADERREQIVSATVRVVAAEGYVGASADAIAREAGVSKGLLWHYFGGQDELMAETARRAVATLRHAVGAAIDLGAPIPEVIRQALHVAAALRITHSAERRAIREISLNLRGPDGAPLLTTRDLDETYAAQEEHIFGRGQREGTLRADLDPRLMAVTYQSTVDGMLDYLDVHPEVDADVFADHIAGVLLGGMSMRR